MTAGSVAAVCAAGPAVARSARRAAAGHDGRYDSPAVTIWQSWYPAFANHVFAPELGTVASGNIDFSMLTNLAARLLDGRSAALPLH